MRALFVYSDQRSSSSSRTLSNEELSRFSVFFFLLLWFSVKTKHAAYLVYAVRVTLEGEETDESKMPSLITGMTESASTWRHRPRLLSPSLSPSLLYNHLYHCIRRSSGKGLLQLPSCTLMWLNNWPLVPLFVCFGDRWIHLNKKKPKKKNRCFGICPPFSRWCLCGWHSQTKEPWWISTLWCVPETLQYKLLAHPQTKKRLTLNVLPPRQPLPTLPEQLQVDTLVYVVI